MTLKERALVGLAWMALLFGMTSLCGTASAQPAATSDTSSSPAMVRGGLRFDVEIDPTAYFLKGYSVHAGVGGDRWRLDIGAYKADVPTWLRFSPVHTVSR